MYQDLAIAGIVYLGLNKSRKIFALYTIIIQFFVTIIGLSLLGYYLGTRLSTDDDLPILLAGLGLMFGVFIGFVTLYKFIRNEERYEKNVHD